MDNFTLKQGLLGELSVSNLDASISKLRFHETIINCNNGDQVHACAINSILTHVNVMLLLFN